MAKSIERSNCSVRFSFKDPLSLLICNKKQESLIFLHCNCSGFRFKYSTKFKSCYEDWDLKRQRIKEGKAGIMNSLYVNEALTRMEVNLKKENSRLVAEGVSVSKELLQNFLDGLTNKNVVVVKNVNLNFFDFAEQLLEVRSKNLSLITARSYKQTILKLKAFEKHQGSKFTFESFDINFYNAFTEFLEIQDYSINTINKHFKNLKVFLNNALENGYSTSLKFKSRDFKLKTEDSSAVYLTEEEIQAMFEHDLSKHKHLEDARDIFLIGCYTGQRISDYNGLKAESIKIIKGQKFFEIRQKKTKTIVHSPITIEMQSIMDARHGGLPPKKMNEQYLNDYIKQVGQEVGISDMVTHSITKGGKKIEKRVPKYTQLHSHTARRSFCTNMYKNKMPAIDIMFYSGHKTEREFYKYIRIHGEERAAHIAGLGFFNV